MRYVQGAYTGMPFDRDTFHIIHNFGDPGSLLTVQELGIMELYLKEVYRILEPAGYFIAEGPPAFLDAVKKAGFKKTIFRTKGGASVFIKTLPESSIKGQKEAA